MKKKRGLVILIKSVSLLSILILILSCTPKPGKSDLENAQTSSRKGNYKEATATYLKITKLYPKEKVAIQAAKEGFESCQKERSCELQEYFLNFVIEKSPNQEDVTRALYDLSGYYYEKAFYSKAIAQMNTLLSRSNFNWEKQKIRMKLARSNFYIKNFFQADVELKTYLEQAENDEQRFEGSLLKADILSAQKKFKDAAEVYRQIKEKFPELYMRNQAYMLEALMYEDQKQLDLAISVLEAIVEQAQNKEFVASKIQRLKERKALLPGAEGLKR